jgi:4-amino-4-deoxy-L-arabinose transferase-like glycosyltransferase
VKGLVALVLGVYLALAIAMVLTRQPWCDEGWFASPAVNLVEHGHMGTTVYDPPADLPRFDHLTYWMPPVHFVVQAAFYRVLGVSVVVQRLISVLAGLVALGATFIIARTLTRSVGIAVLAMALLGTDNIFIIGCGDGRMDLLCSALGLAGIASYLALRETRLPLATFAGHALVVTSGLTHPNGILPLALLLVIQVGLDRKRLGAREVALTLVPYLVGAGAWGAYIAQNPRAFLAQFRQNMSGKWSGAPHRAVLAEIRLRWLDTFGFSREAIWWTRVRVLVPIAYATGLVLAFKRSKSPGGKLAVALAALELALLTFIIGNKSSAYLVHVIPLLAVAGAIGLAAVERRLAVSLALALTTLQVGTTVGQELRDRRHTVFFPVADAARAAAPEDGLVVGSAELAFALGFERVRDDASLGIARGRDPVVLVLDNRYRSALADLDGTDPARAKLVRARLERFHLLLRNDEYEVYGR